MGFGFFPKSLKFSFQQDYPFKITTNRTSFCASFLINAFLTIFWEFWWFFFVSLVENVPPFLTIFEASQVPPRLVHNQNNSLIQPETNPKADVERIIIAYVTKKSAAKAAANAARHKAGRNQQIFLVWEWRARLLLLLLMLMMMMMMMVIPHCRFFRSPHFIFPAEPGTSTRRTEEARGELHTTENFQEQKTGAWETKHRKVYHFGKACLENAAHVWGKIKLIGRKTALFWLFFRVNKNLHLFWMRGRDHKLDAKLWKLVKLWRPKTRVLGPQMVV